MYDYISGIVDMINPDRVTIEAGGIGYELICSTATLGGVKVGAKAKLFTYLHIAQDAIALYGFESIEERAMFKKLIGVTRVGPKLALSVLSTLSVSDIVTAILTQNAAALSKVSGMGSKTAARVLLELKESMGALEIKGAGASLMTESSLDMRTEAIAALVELGLRRCCRGQGRLLRSPRVTELRI